MRASRLALLVLAIPIALPLAAQQPVPAGTVIVANQQSADASLVALPGGVERRVAVGVGPHEALVAPGGDWAVVTIYGNRESVGSSLAVIDLATGAVAKRVELGPYSRPHTMAALPGPGRRILVTSEATRNVVLVDLDRGEVEAAIPTEAPGSHMVAVTADGARAFTANIPTGTVSEIDLVARKFVRTIPVNQPVTEGIAVTPDGREVWIGSNQTGVVSVIDTRAGAVAATVDGFKVPYRIGVSPDGSLVAVVDPETASVGVIDRASRRVLGSVALAGSPRGVAFAPDGRTMFITVVGADGAGSVAAVDVASRRVTGTWNVGTAPDGVAFRPRD